MLQYLQQTRRVLLSEAQILSLSSRCDSQGSQLTDPFFPPPTFLNLRPPRAHTRSGTLVGYRIGQGVQLTLQLRRAQAGVIKAWELTLTLTPTLVLTGQKHRKTVGVKARIAPHQTPFEGLFQLL